jgi:hypothetical protein
MNERKEKRRRLEMEQSMNASSSSFPEYTHEPDDSEPLGPQHQSARDLLTDASDVTPLVSGDSNLGSYSTNSGGECV